MPPGNSTTSLIVDFDAKTDPNTDYILAQSRETLAASQLPVDVTNYGVTVRKSVTAPLTLIAVYSPHGTYDANFLANYAYINLVDPHSAFARHRQRSGIRRRPIRDAIVGKAGHVGQARHHRPGNRQRHSGAKHREPSREGGRRTGSQRSGIYLLSSRAGPPSVSGRIRTDCRARDARRRAPFGSAMWLASSLGSQDYSVAGRFNGKPSAVIATYQLPGSNAVDAAAGVNKLMAKMKERFPEDLDYVVALDTTRVRSRKV